MTDKDFTSQQRLPAGTFRFGFLKSEVYYATSGKGRDIAGKKIDFYIKKILHTRHALCFWRFFLKQLQNVIFLPAEFPPPKHLLYLCPTSRFLDILFSSEGPTQYNTRFLDIRHKTQDLKLFIWSGLFSLLSIVQHW